MFRVLVARSGAVRRGLGHCLLAVTLTGCAAMGEHLTPSPAEASLTLPASFAHAAEASRAHQTATEFWTAFRSQDLADLIRRAELGSRDIGVALSRLRQAEAGAEEAFAGQLPSGGLGGSQTTFQASANTAGLPAGVEMPVRQQRKVGLNASWELDFWGKASSNFAAAANRADAAAFAVAATRLTVTSETALSYVQILSLRDRLGLARENLVLARKVEENVRARVEAGSATQIMQAQQETVVLQQEATVLRLQRALAQEEISLALLVGATPGEIRITRGSLGRLSIPALVAGAPADLLRRRPDVRQAEELLAASANNVASARAAMLPSLTLTLQKGFESVTTGALFSGAAGVFSVAGQLAQPIFDMPRLVAQLEGTQARRQELVTTYQQSVMSALADVEKALIAYGGLAREERVAARATAAARKAHDLTLEQLEAGQVDMTTVLNTQRDYFTAVDSLQQVRLARFQSAIALYRAMGGGWTEQDVARLIAERDALAAAAPVAPVTEAVN
ncbi:efflux transporter outer membrane subunit [Microvirga tunisiensis]|uniref:Efflux transporter outer membrane subunit n=1 Tax=Pannonibacter tanglangensis TaxID=2750084 RepID=A0A7X5J9L7_9HYPH|nr:efflux transporter outer membrane subunit [Pannonibacter sp. XCT-53]NBN79949.1 efflux transporter outer membrane subunit [Pannonibacter sp. XCT-53]